MSGHLRANYRAVGSRFGRGETYAVCPQWRAKEVFAVIKVLQRKLKLTPSSCFW